MNIAERQAGALQGVLLLLPMTMAVMGLVVLVPVSYTHLWGSSLPDAPEGGGLDPLVHL